jgi:hypothetical protein
VGAIHNATGETAVTRHRTHSAPVRDGLRPSAQRPKPEAARLYRERCRERSVCVRCGSDGLVTATHCTGCREKHNVYNIGLRRRRLAAGGCASCGNPRGEGGSPTLCGRCREKHRVKSEARRRARGVRPKVKP